MTKSDIKEGAKSRLRAIESFEAANPGILRKNPWITFCAQENKPGKTKRPCGNGSPIHYFIETESKTEKTYTNLYRMSIFDFVSWIDRRWPWWSSRGIDNDWPNAYSEDFVSLLRSIPQPADYPYSTPLPVHAPPNVRHALARHGGRVFKNSL